MSGSDYKKSTTFYSVQLFAVVVIVSSVNVPSYKCWEQAGFCITHSLFLPHKTSQLGSSIWEIYLTDERDKESLMYKPLFCR